MIRSFINAAQTRLIRPTRLVRSPFAVLVVDPMDRYSDNNRTETAIANIDRMSPAFQQQGALMYWIFDRGMNKVQIDDPLIGYRCRWREDGQNFPWPKNGYSSFLQNSFPYGSKLAKHLRHHGVQHLFICGINLSTCVYFTTRDALNPKFGFNVYVIDDLCADNDANTFQTGIRRHHYQTRLADAEFVSSAQAVRLMEKLKPEPEATEDFAHHM